jgi:NitT/TauT family transport system ATP-binding protein
MPQFNLVEIEHLTRKFNKNIILEDFSLQIRAGSFVALLGSSGSGKSSLLRLIAGLDQPDAGKISVQSERAFQMSFVFQDANLLPWRSVRENLQLVLELTGLKGEVREVLELVGLTEHADKFPNQLSGGMRMRASVARALMTRPNLDEPFAALDENTRYHLQEELYQIWQKQKMTIIFVTHSISEAVFLSERAILIGGSPARVVLDHPISLNRVRNAELRTTPEYLANIKVLSEHFDPARIR